MSDTRARFKPCLRCGYSLLHIAGAKNCPECGLAIRISLSANRSLEWSNPRWQRFLALALGVLAFGLFCRTLGSAADWIIYGDEQDYYVLGSTMLWVLAWLSRITGQSHLIACGSALCLLAKGERRHPDRTRSVRRIVLAAGILVLFLGMLRAFVGPGFWVTLPPWVLYIYSRLLCGPWIPLIIGVLASTYALGVANRGNSRLLLRMSQLPAWPTALGLILWLLNLDRLVWPLRSLVWDWLFPLSTIIMLALTIRVLLRSAREADTNWVTDP